MNETVKLNNFSTQFQVDLWSFPLDVWKYTCELVKCLYKELKRFLFCHKKFLSVQKLVTYKIYFRHQSDFLFHIYKTVANAN